MADSRHPVENLEISVQTMGSFAEVLGAPGCRVVVQQPLEGKGKQRLLLLFRGSKDQELRSAGIDSHFLFLTAPARGSEAKTWSIGREPICFKLVIYYLPIRANIAAVLWRGPCCLGRADSII